MTLKDYQRKLRENPLACALLLHRAEMRRWRDDDPLALEKAWRCEFKIRAALMQAGDGYYAVRDRIEHERQQFAQQMRATDRATDLIRRQADEAVPMDYAFHPRDFPEVA